jgi:hypothetical protein
MVKINRITACLGLIVLLVILTGICYAQPMPPDRASGPDIADPGSYDGQTAHKEGDPHMGVPVETIVCGGGLALQNNETHLLRLNVVRLSPLEPGKIRDLLVSNKSIEEIREAFKAEEGQSLYRGNMKLDDVVYPLIHIRVLPSGDNATIVDADLAFPDSNPTNLTSVVGHIMAIIHLSNAGWIGEGQLNIDNIKQRGSYHVLLDKAGNSHSKPFESKKRNRESEK